ncbi:Centromere protein X isoform 3 [Hibiscus syriacus]|uniref:Centromere protein X isoform 3 n=1 Tax=Hibiscus syriacus TaxID=106335 RepID=A0A6A2Y917_HIBSY|nr:Centromere protein X isoform 3 [Hibiscus syriacus]
MCIKLLTLHFTRRSTSELRAMAASISASLVISFEIIAITSIEPTAADSWTEAAKSQDRGANQINSAMMTTKLPFLNLDSSSRFGPEKLKREGIDFHHTDAMDSEVVAGTSKKIRPTFANPNALKLSCQLVRIFITEAVQRAATVAEAEGGAKVEAIH